PLPESQGGQDLLRILHHQAAYHYTHKRLLTTALDWERQGRNPDYLLSREELSQYQDWLQGALQRSRYRPIQLQVLFVATSHMYLMQQTRTSLPLWLQQANALAKTRIW
ncbi:MAG: hypothetical protein HC922_02945, partial [Leptolyngbyaceae cyanobacterium SM2_3_12]|nr:hypothetical protein [Leptolyngbyaceae cyanobacterium SM2_3_12]